MQTQTQIQIPQIYCINLKSSKDRRKRMDARFRNLNLQDRVTYIDGISRDSPMIDYYHQYATQQYPDTYKWRSEMGCFASHLKAIRKFLEDGHTECLICEDDIMFHNDFIILYQEIRSNIVPTTPFIGLSYMICHWKGCKWTGSDPNQHNLYTTNEEVWGMQLYWISQKYAIEVLTKFDKPYKDNEYLHTSEVIIRNPDCVLAYPVLAIEESIDSERSPEDLPYHKNHFQQWGIDNYTNYEPEPEPEQ